MNIPRSLEPRLLSCPLLVGPPVAALCACLALWSAPALALSTFVVTSAADSGPGSLRQAMLEANAAGGVVPNQIRFDIAGGAVIEVLSPLPSITAPLVIDGYTQPGTAFNTASLGINAVLRIALDGGETSGAGLTVAASQVTIRGLAIGGFETGILVVGTVHGTRIEGNFIGTDETGAIARPNVTGIRVAATDGAPAETRIGGLFGTGARNLISGNTLHGVLVDSDVTGLAIMGNRIGTSSSGATALPNGVGIVVDGSAPAAGANAIGNGSVDAANVVAGNAGPGLALRHATGYDIVYNHIGVAADGAPLGNGGDGLVLGRDGALTPATGLNIDNNTIAHNGGAGVRVLAGSGNRIRANAIHDNAALGIDLGGDGPTPNDPGDSDVGPNGLQNHPILSVPAAGLDEVTLVSAPQTQYRLDYYASTVCDPSGYGEGQQFIGFVTVTTDANGFVSVFRGSSTPPGRPVLTATATAPDGSTSEFSPCIELAQPTGTLSGSVTLDGQPLAGVRVDVTGGAQASTTTTTAGTYSFTLVRGASYSVVPRLAGYRFSPAGISLGLVQDSTVDFEATRVLTLTGRVTDITGAGISGVLVQQSASPFQEVETDSDGRYTLTNIPIGASFGVEVSKPGFIFDPATRAFVPLQDDPAPTEASFEAVTGDFRRHFAEGATSPFFDTRLALLNTTDTDAAAVIDFQRADGEVVPYPVMVPAGTRATLDVKTVRGLEQAEFSTVVRSQIPLVVDRTMTWDATGYGSHAESSVAAPASTWYLAEGATIDGFELFYLLQNPSGAHVTATIRYLRPAPQPPIVLTYDVAPRSRRTIWVNQEDPGLAATEVSAVVESFTPIIVERAMYRHGPGRTFLAGHASAGVTAPRTEWYLAEGATGPYFDLFVLVANPTASHAPITATFLLPDGTTYVKQYVVPPNSRFNIWVDEEQLPDGSGFRPLADTAVSTRIVSTNDVPLIVERAMWWPGTSTSWHEGHNTAGATASGTSWVMADGESGGTSNVETYILLANVSPGYGLARVTLFFEDGSKAEREFPLEPTSRFNVAVSAEFPEAVGRRYGALVESLGPTPVQLVVERAMYQDAAGVRWAAGSVALATRIQ